MKFISMHKDNMEDKIKGLPAFLQVLHMEKSKKAIFMQTEPTESEYESLLVPYDKRNRYAINAETGSESESDSEVIQMLRDPKIECQKLHKKISETKKYENQEETLFEILTKYISIINSVKQMCQLQPLIDSLNCSYAEIEPLVCKINNKLCQALVYEKFSDFDKAFHALLYYMKSSIFCEKSKRKKSSSIILQNETNLKDCFLKILKICQKEFWKSRKEINFINLLQNVQVFIESCYEMKLSEQISDSLVDFLLLTVRKICTNLSPRVIKNSFFEKHSIQLNSEVYKTLSEELFLTLKTQQPFYKSAWRCFEVSDKKCKKKKRDEKKKAVAVRKVCNFCNCFLLEDSLITVYGCGHSFHSYCDSEKQYCIECSYVSDQKLCKFEFILDENVIYSKFIENELQELSNGKKITKNTKNKNETIKIRSEEKDEKMYNLRRKLKIYDYEEYQRQKITLNLMRRFEV